MIISNQDLLVPFYNNNKLPKNFVISDKDYFCPTQAMIVDEIFPKYWRWMQSLKWSKWMHKWDCDNFADAFKLFACGYYEQVIESTANGIAIGVINYMANQRAEDGLKGGHAINIIASKYKVNPSIASCLNICLPWTVLPINVCFFQLKTYKILHNYIIKYNL